MSDLKSFQSGQMEGTRLAGVTVTETSQLVGLSKDMIFNAMKSYTQDGKKSLAKQNSGQKKQVSKIE